MRYLLPAATFSEEISQEKTSLVWVFKMWKIVFYFATLFFSKVHGQESDQGDIIKD
jgi:hypothetical protein